MKPIFGLPVGISITFWAIVGLLRYIWEKRFEKKITYKKSDLKIKDLVALIPAHNEELVIRSSIAALKKSLPANQIYVVSDGSTDATYTEAKKEDCHVVELEKGRGKARAILYLIKTYKLFEKYKLIFIVDADTQIDKACVRRALPMFNDPKMAVVFAASRIKWQPHFLPRLNFYFIAYRERLNRILSFFLIYGQTWRYISLSYVLPGFAVIYRSNILKQLKIDTPGILIEDFNLAFQFQKKKLGRIGYDPSLIGWDQFPDNLPDYWRQVRRWNIGFFQTVKKNGIWLSFFWLALGVFSLEVIVNSFFILLLPLILIPQLLVYLPPLHDSAQEVVGFMNSLNFFNFLTLREFLAWTFFSDYAMTVLIGFACRKPQFIIYGIFFFFMHFVTSLILISSIIPGFFSSSSGKWTHPKRLRS